MRAAIPLAVAAALLAAPLPAAAVNDYDECIAMIATDPVRAEREAGEWARFGGGAAARHCYALSLIEIGATGRATEELLAIAFEEPDLEDAARADILVQAGELLIDGGNPEDASPVATQALRLAPRNAGALGLRAAVSLDQGDVSGALGDLDAALATNPTAVRLLLLRSSAHRRLGNPVSARDDASFATELAPTRPEAWLERGRAEAAAGDRPGARKSFLKAINLDRDGKIGRRAQNALQRMEAGLKE